MEALNLSWLQRSGLPLLLLEDRPRRSLGSLLLGLLDLDLDIKILDRFPDELSIPPTLSLFLSFLL